MRIAVFQATELLNQEQGTEMLVALAESWVTAGCRLKGWRCSELTESSLQCPSCLQSHHLGYTWIHSCVLLRSFSSRLRLWEVVSRRELMFFPFDNRRAGTAESSEGGSRELVQLSILLTVRSLLAGASGGIKLGQQLASSEQNQAITGYFPTCNLPVQGARGERFPFVLPPSAKPHIHRLLHISFCDLSFLLWGVDRTGGKQLSGAGCLGFGLQESCSFWFPSLWGWAASPLPQSQSVGTGSCSHWNPLGFDLSGSPFPFFPPHTTGREILVFSHWVHPLGWL